MRSNTIFLIMAIPGARERIRLRLKDSSYKRLLKIYVFFPTGRGCDSNCLPLS